MLVMLQEAIDVSDLFPKLRRIDNSRLSSSIFDEQLGGAVEPAREVGLDVAGAVDEGGEALL